MKKLLVVFISVLCVLTACNRGPNPKHSLIAAGNAIQNFDANAVDKYIDISSIINSAIDVAAKQEVKGISKEEIMGMTAAKMIIVPIAKQFILEGIRQAANSEYKEYVKLVKVKEYKILSNKEGIATAKVTFNFEDAKQFALDKNLVPEETKPYMEDTETTLMLKMQQNGEYWQITEITNLDELMKKYAPLYEEQKRQSDLDKAIAEAFTTVNIICQYQSIYYLGHGKVSDRFADFEIDFVEDDGKIAQNSSFIKDGVAYVLSKNKIIAYGPKESEYTLEKDCILNSDIKCKDNGNGMCKRVGL